MQLAELREKDFGSLEGKRSRDNNVGRAATLVEPETGEALRIRASRFLDAVLFPLLRELVASSSNASVVIVAHGLIHTSLWQEFAPRDKRLAEGPGLSDSPPADEFLSNTGYHEAVVRPSIQRQDDPSGPHSFIVDESERTLWLEAKFEIVAINSKSHLAGLRKTRGGIGSAAFDSKQRTVDSFFAPSVKKRKANDN